MLSYPTDPELPSAEPRRLVRIGELLTTSGIVSPEQLREGLRRAAETDLPLGKILVWSGYLTDEVLRQAVHVQCLLNDKAIAIEDAVAWLSQEAGTKAAATAAKAESKPVPKHEVPDKEVLYNRLGDLMVAAGMLDESRLEEALTDSVATGLPLGRILAYTKNIPDLHIAAALDAQVAIREYRVNREAAIDAMKVVRQKNVPFEQALAALGFEAEAQHFSQLVTLLRISGIISESKLVTAQEMAIVKGKPLAEILVEFKFLDVRAVGVAVGASAELIEGKINLNKAVSTVKRTVENRFEESDPLGVAKSNSVVSAADLLKLARLIDAEQIRRVTPPELQTFKVTNSKQENVDQTLTIALKCVDLIESKELTLEQAIVVLHYCCRKNISLPVVLELIGFDPPQADS